MRGGRSETEHLLRARDVVLGDLGGAGHATGHLGGLLLQVVALAGLLPEDLAAAGDPEPLAGTGVRLVLRHVVLSLPVESQTRSGVDLGVEVLGAAALLLLRDLAARDRKGPRLNS